MGFAMMTALLLSVTPVPSAVAASDAEVRSAQAVWNECVERTKTIWNGGSAAEPMWAARTPR